MEEVRNFISQYNHSFFSQDVFIYIEKSGKYLIVEPYTMTDGNDATYILSNFCPSVTDLTYANKLDRYRKGIEYLKTKIDTTSEFCRSLSDTMHVCRERIGDGTLLTSNWDLKNGIVTLYFYHDYDHSVVYNLRDELAKGDHFFEIPKLFPTNAEFQRLLSFRIPHNTPNLKILLFSFGVLFSFSAVFFLISYLRTRKTAFYAYLMLYFIPLGIIMTFYMYSLLTNIGIFYSPAPYQDYVFTIQNIVAYVPYLLLLLIIPLYIKNWHILKTSKWSIFSKLLLSINSLTFSILICLFVYWGLYNIF